MVELLSIQDRFAATFPLEADVEPETTQQKSRLPERATDVERTGISIPDTTSLVVDLSAFLEGTQMALPSLNGIYVVRFGLFHEYASCRYSRKNFLLALILVISYCRNRHSDSKQSEEELLSFSVPCDISMKREEEPWAKSFLARVNGKLERCSQVWASVRLEIEVFQSQSGVIVL
uniref:Uncharacterized protein n=1 Tax=Aegilops tauschii TaxID=37682 RepID=R7W8B7_AEGTA